MRNALFLLLLSFATLCEAQLPVPLEENPGASKSLGYKKVAEALSSLRSKRGASIQTTQPDGWTIITFPEPEFSIWSFTPDGHYAHPAVVRRTVEQRNGMTFLEMTAICENTKDSCDKLMREFQALNNQVRSEISGPMSSSKQD
jgi:hypothetical protein